MMGLSSKSSGSSSLALRRSRLWAGALLCLLPLLATTSCKKSAPPAAVQQEDSQTRRIAALTAKLLEPDAEQAADAARELGANARQSVPTLIRALKSDSPKVRTAAVRALLKLRNFTDNLQDQLMSMLGEDDVTTLETVLKGLQQITPAKSGGKPLAYPVVEYRLGAQSYPDSVVGAKIDEQGMHFECYLEDDTYKLDMCHTTPITHRLYKLRAEVVASSMEFGDILGQKIRQHGPPQILSRQADVCQGENLSAYGLSKAVDFCAIWDDRKTQLIVGRFGHTFTTHHPAYVVLTDRAVESQAAEEAGQYSRREKARKEAEENEKK